MSCCCCGCQRGRILRNERHGTSAKADPCLLWAVVLRDMVVLHLALQETVLLLALVCDLFCVSPYHHCAQYFFLLPPLLPCTSYYFITSFFPLYLHVDTLSFLSRWTRHSQCIRRSTQHSAKLRPIRIGRPLGAIFPEQPHVQRLYHRCTRMFIFASNGSLIPFQNSKLQTDIYSLFSFITAKRYQFIPNKHRSVRSNPKNTIRTQNG